MQIKNTGILKRVLILTVPVWGLGLAIFLESMRLKHFCLIEFFTGQSCWGCGLTRAFAELGKFNFQQAYDYNPLIVIFAPLAFVAWVLIVYFEFRGK